MFTIINWFSNLSSIDGRFATALLNVILIIVCILLIGLLMSTTNYIITLLLGYVIGQRPASYVRNYATYPGTIHHEFAHALFAFLTGAKVTAIHLKPRGATLGSVEFTPRGNFITKNIQITISSIAPVVCGICTLWLLHHFVYPYCTLWWQIMLYVYFFICIFLHMNMSTQDIKNARIGFPLCMAILYLVFLIWHINLLSNLLIITKPLFA